MNSPQNPLIAFLTIAAISTILLLAVIAIVSILLIITETRDRTIPLLINKKEADPQGDC